MDVKSAFLNRFLKEEIYVEQPQEFTIPGCEAKVYKLYRALYGLKQAPKAWYERIDSHLTEMGFERTISEPTLYVKKIGNETLLIISLYVDDLLVIGSNNKLVIVFKDQIQEKFEMSDLGQMTYFLSLEVNQAHNAVFINQKGFAIKILRRYSMKNCKPVKLLGYSDNDWVGSSKDMKSTLGYFFTLGSLVVNQAIWLRKLLNDLNLKQEEATKIKCDNQSAVAIAKNLVFHGRTKHFKIKYHFVKEVEQAKEVTLVHYSSQDQLADILTKPLGKMRFEKLCYDIGVPSMENEEDMNFKAQLRIEVQAAYKRALLRFHRDRESKTDIRRQDETEENFKPISRMKGKFLVIS
ncbi:Integrase, catalytic core [Gossypium australe]|uniref:Integrase, catalytic core n=1 Tax=Gossypium australe TaxID=47621 RepID=A0A5B6X2G3_9ROSI|nr:Integrase, catalytic core [Gossypium australe]